MKGGRPLKTLSALIGLWVGGRIYTHLQVNYAAPPAVDTPQRSLTIEQDMKPGIDITKMQSAENKALPGSNKFLAHPWAKHIRTLPIAGPISAKEKPMQHAPSPRLRSAVIAKSLVDMPVPHIPIFPVPKLLVQPVMSSAKSLALPSPMPITPIPHLSHPTSPRQNISATQDRFNLSGWGLIRAGVGRTTLAANGQLGGSQIGARLSARITETRNGPVLAAYGRVTTPLAQKSGKEAAAGLSLRLANKKAPLEITIERRIAASQGGTNAWAIGMSGGFYDMRLIRKFRLSGYAQAGIVGHKERSSFAEGTLELTHPISKALELGAIISAANQPRLHRLDIGPALNIRLPSDTANLRFSVQWRHRIAGQAAPASGPTLILGADF